MRQLDRRKRDRAQDLRALERGAEKDLAGLIGEVTTARISRRQFLERTLALGFSASAAATLLAACGSTTTSATSSASPAYPTTKPDQIVYYGWSELMDQETPKAFHRETGIRLVVRTFDDNEGLFAKLKGGASGYDVITPSDYMVHLMWKTGIVLPLDMSLIPNFDKYTLATFVKPPYDNGASGKKYSTPWNWGTTALAYRTDKVSEPVTDWDILWNKKYKGQIVMLNDQRECIASALLLLGYSINTTSQAELDAATAKLIEQKPLVKVYDSWNNRRWMVQGVALHEAWNGDVLAAYRTVGDKIKYVYPQKGYPLWSDGCMIPTGAKSPYGAHVFMNYMCVPQNAARIVNFSGYMLPFKGIETYVDPKVVKFYPTEEELKRAQLYDDVGAFTDSYTQAWTKIKSS